MNVLDAIRKRFDDAKRYTEKRKEENKRENEELNMDADSKVVPFVINVLKKDGVITAEKAAEFLHLYDGRTFINTEWGTVTNVSVIDFVNSMLEEIGNKNVCMFYWYRPIAGLCANVKLPYCISELGRDVFFGSYSKYFESIETKNYVVVVITDYKALLQAVKAGFEGKIAKRDAEAKAFRKKHEEDIAFYEQFRQARNIMHEVEAKEYNNKYPNLLCSAAISSADEELAKLD